MPSEITKRRCKQIKDQASEYLNFWLYKGLPAFMLWAAIVYTSGVILHYYNVLPDVGFQIITSLTLSPFLVVLLLCSWSLLTQDRHPRAAERMHERTSRTAATNMPLFDIMAYRAPSDPSVGKCMKVLSSVILSIPLVIAKLYRP